MSTNLEYRARERQRKRENRRQASEAQPQTKKRATRRRTTWKFCSSGNKMRNSSGHQCKVKMSGREKKVNEKTYDISCIKRLTKRCLEVSRCSRAKQRQRNVEKKCAAQAKLLFCQLYLLLFFTVLRRCLRRLASHDFIFCLNKL